MAKQATHINKGGPHIGIGGLGDGIVQHGDQCTPTAKELAAFPDKFVPILAATVGADDDVAGPDVKVSELEEFLAKCTDADVVRKWYNEDDRSTAEAFYEARLEELEE